MPTTKRRGGAPAGLCCGIECYCGVTRKWAMAKRASSRRVETPVLSNMLERWRKRVVSIAKDLSQSDDTSRFVKWTHCQCLSTDVGSHYRQESFETAVRNVAQRFIEASVNQPDTIIYRLEPETHANRERALIEGDEILNSFQVRFAFILHELRHLTFTGL